jgi:uncharacterized protein YdhG (YjbR/CyaY superfamily)
MAKRRDDDEATARAGAAEVDAYLAAQPEDQRRALEALRATIRSSAPGMTERISYRIATCRLQGRPLVGFGATKNHCSFYLMSTEVLATHRDELERYDTAKGTIHFQPGSPLPKTLVRRLVRARIEENERPA